MNEESPDLSKDILENIISATETSTFHVAEDVYDQSGNKLLGKGYRITPKIKAHLLNRILKKPIETSIKSNNPVTATYLGDSALEELTSNSILTRLKGSLKTEAKELKYLSLDPLASLLLTVIRDSEPEHFKHALFVTLLAKAMAKEMKLGSYDIANLSLSCLLHDIGELYVSIPQEEKLTDEHWHKVMVHPILGSSIVAKHMNYPKEFSVAILEHHERCNGNGYPRHIDANSCSVNGQILIMAEAIAGMVKREKKLQGALMVLRLSFTNYPTRPLNAFKNIVDLNSYVLTDNNTDFTQDTIKATLKSFNDIRIKVIEYIKDNRVNSIARHLEARLLIVEQSLSESGITHYLDDVFWKESLGNQTIRIELEVTVQEIEWQVQDIARHLAKTC